MATQNVGASWSAVIPLSINHVQEHHGASLEVLVLAPPSSSLSAFGS